MNNIKAEIVAHSLNTQGDELISILCTFPRIILSEMNTHRMLSKNTSSSRAIPFNKMVEAVDTNPFIPIAWQKQHSGMQGSEYFSESEAYWNIDKWLEARNNAVKIATLLTNNKVTKQLANRLLEPFSWTTMLITGSKEGWDNFFKLRCPQYQTPVSQSIEPQYSWKDLINNHGNEDNLVMMKKMSVIEKLQLNKGQAEIHIMDLAEKIWDAKNESTPKLLEAGEWHIPFEDKIDTYNEMFSTFTNGERFIDFNEVIKVSVALAARTSYTVVGEEKEIDYQKMIDLHDRLLAQDPPHSSPFEHCCRALNDEEYYQAMKTVQGVNREKHLVRKDWGWVNNIKGFMPYRYMVDNNLKM